LKNIEQQSKERRLITLSIVELESSQLILDKTMRKLILFTVVLTYLVIACTNKKNHSHEENDAHEGYSVKENNDHSVKPLSPHTSTMAMIGSAHIHIDYSSPNVRGRVIFGGLVSYDDVWVSGAHMATWIETNKDLLIKGEILPKGKYGFFTIPGKNEWILIFNSDWDQHGTHDYDPNADVLRFTVTPEFMTEVKEELTYDVIKSGDNSGSISLTWDKVKLKLDFMVAE
jgi:hypothetical protein